MFYFTPLPGFFSPFPRGTGSLSVTDEYLALRGGPRRFTRNFSCTVLLRIRLVKFKFNYEAFTLYGVSFKHFISYHLYRVPSYNPSRSCPLVWAVSRSLAATQEIIVYFLFLQLLRCFSSLGSLLPAYGFNGQYIGLPHSETSGSKFVSNSPERIAGNCVLHRLSVPRYPP